MSKISKIFYDDVKHKLETNNVPVRISQYNDHVYHFSFEKNGEPTGFLPVMREKRSILVVDINQFTKKSMEQQLLLVEILKYHISKTYDYLRNIKDISWVPWYLYKSTGDGGIFVFGDSPITPGSTRDAFTYAIWLMRFIAEYNAKSNGVNQLKVRMALSYGDIYATKELNGNDEIIGDNINMVSRFINADVFKANAILITEEYFNIFNDNKYINRNNDGLLFVADEIIRKRKNKNNFVELIKIKEIENEDFVIKPYYVNGKIDGYLLCYN